MATACGGDGEPACSECGPPRIAVGEDAVWVAQGADLHRLDPATGEITRTTTVLPARRSSDIESVAVRDGLVRVTAGRTAVLVDAGGVVVRRTRLDRPPSAGIGHRPTARAGLVAIGDGVVWTLTDDGTLTGREPGSGRAVAGPVDVGDDPRTLATGDAAVFAGLRHPSVVRVDPASGRIAWRRDIPYS